MPDDRPKAPPSPEGQWLSDEEVESWTGADYGPIAKMATELLAYRRAGREVRAEGDPAACGHPCVTCTPFAAGKSVVVEEQDDGTVVVTRTTGAAAPPAEPPEGELRAAPTDEAEGDESR